METNSRVRSGHCQWQEAKAGSHVHPTLDTSQRRLLSTPAPRPTTGPRTRRPPAGHVLPQGERGAERPPCGPRVGSTAPHSRTHHAHHAPAVCWVRFLSTQTLCLGGRDPSLEASQRCQSHGNSCEITSHPALCPRMSRSSVWGGDSHVLLSAWSRSADAVPLLPDSRRPG